MSSKLYQKVKNFIPEVEWAVYEPLVEKINKLKAEKNAVILAHNYMTLTGEGVTESKSRYDYNVWCTLYGRDGQDT